MPVHVTVEGSPAGARPRGRFVAVAGAIAVLSAAGGFLIGRASGPDGARVTSTPASTTPATTSASTVPAASDGSSDPAATSATTSGAASGAASAIEVPMSVDEDTSAGAASGDMAAPGGSGSWMPNAYAEPEQTFVLERALSDATVIRVHGQWYEGDMYGGWPEFGDWEPEPWCQPTGSLRVAIAAPDSINVTWAPWFREAKDGLAVSTFATGYAEGAPRFGVVAQVPDDVTSVTLTTPTGSDTAEPVASEAGPIVVLLVPGPITDDVRLDLATSSGSRTATPSDLTEAWNSPEYRAACQPPPPALPEPGEQPADPAAAEAAVRAAFDATRGEDAAARLAVVDDVSGLEAAWTAISEGPFADAAATATLTIREFVFSTPTEAWFRYDIDSSVSDFTDRYGRAVQGDDGVWRITRDTVCQDLSLAGGNCEPMWAPVLPPSAATDPRYGAMPMFEGDVSVVTTMVETTVATG